MQVAFSPEDLRPLISAIVAELAVHLAPMDDRLAAPEPEAARIIGINSHQLRDCRRRGEIKGRKIGKTWVYSREALARFLAEGGQG
jgi:hypothetical protein